MVHLSHWLLIVPRHSVKTGTLIPASPTQGMRQQRNRIKKSPKTLWSQFQREVLSWVQGTQGLEWEEPNKSPCKQHQPILDSPGCIFTPCPRSPCCSCCSVPSTQWDWVFRFWPCAMSKVECYSSIGIFFIFMSYPPRSLPECSLVRGSSSMLPKFVKHSPCWASVGPGDTTSTTTARGDVKSWENMTSAFFPPLNSHQCLPLVNHTREQWQENLGYVTHMSSVPAIETWVGHARRQLWN